MCPNFDDITSGAVPEIDWVAKTVPIVVAAVDRMIVPMPAAVKGKVAKTQIVVGEPRKKP